MTVKLFIKWLKDNFPQDAILVSTNSRAWNNKEVERVKAEELPYMFFLKENPEKNGKPINRPCLVIRDEDRFDY